MERLGQFGSLHRAVLADEQLLEEPLVNLPSYVVWRIEVGELTAGGGLKGVAEGGFDVSVGRLGGLDLTLSTCQLSSEALHLAGEQVLRDGPGVEGLQQALPLILSSLLALGRSFKALPGVMLLTGEFRADGLPDPLGVLGTHLECAVEGGDGILDLLDPQGPPDTVVFFRLAFHAPEVRIGAASAFLLGVDQAATAGRAINGAAKIMWMNPVFLSVAVSGQDVLNGQPHVRFDEDGVFAFIVDSFVGHYAHVVWVLQNMVHACEANGFARGATFWSACQPLGLCGQRQIDTRPFACSVLREAPADDLRSIGIELDPGVLNTATSFAAVDVAEWCSKGCATFFSLGHQPLHNLLGQVP
jgi:hypothetical protein